MEELCTVLSNGTLLKEVEGSLDELDTPAKSSFLTAMRRSCESLKKSDYKTSHEWLKVLMEWSWEQLHVMHWKDLPVSHRRVYAYVALLEALVYCREGDYVKAMETIDKGLLMGAPVLNDSLQRWAGALNSSIREREECKRKQDTGIESIDSIPTKKLKRDATDIVFSFSTDAPPLPTGEVIEVLRSPPSLLHFKEEYMNKERPVLIKGCMDHWPAMSHRQWR